MTTAIADPTPATPATPVATVSDPPPAVPTPADPAATADPTPAAPVVPATPPAPAPADPAPVTYALALPENALLGAEDLAFAAQEATALGLSQEQAQTLVHARNDALVASAAAFLQDAKADPELGGAKWDETVKFAQAGIAFAFTNAEERALATGWFNRTGLGNHKVFLRAMARIGKARAEDRATNTSAATGMGETAKPTADVLFPSSAKA